MRKLLPLIPLLLAGCARFSTTPTSESESEAAFQRVAADYVTGYLVWRPQVGTTLGFHEYDGGITDYRRASIEGELQRLKTYDPRLAELNVLQLTRRSAYHPR